jgi:hypothetical protein
MKIKPLYLTITIVIIVALLILGCDKQKSIQELLGANYTSAVVNSGDTTYVEINPAWDGLAYGGFNNPSAIISGYDGLLYVIDTDNNRLIQLDEAGQKLKDGEKEILKPNACTQDLRLDLLVCGVIYREATSDTIPALFRIHLYRSDYDASNHHLSSAKIDTIYKEPSRPNRRFKGVAMMTNNQFLLLRDGPDNSSFIDPDTRLLWFTSKSRKDTLKDGDGNIIGVRDTVIDKMFTPVGDIATRSGQGLTDILRPTGICTFPNSNDFIITQSSVGGTMINGALWMVYIQRPDFEGWLPKFDVRKPEEKNRDFIKPNRFKEAAGVAVDGSRLDIFIIDSELDSLVKFDRRGNYKPESFGNGTIRSSWVNPGTDSLQRPALKNPKGVAYRVSAKTLYVVDSGNNKIRRFRLSTDR